LKEKTKNNIEIVVPYFNWF